MATGVEDRYVAISDRQVLAGTGRDWAEWIALLDAWDEGCKGFVPIMEYLIRRHGLNKFWAQAVAVYYRWGQWVKQ